MGKPQEITVTNWDFRNDLRGWRKGDLVALSNFFSCDNEDSAFSQYKMISDANSSEDPDFLKRVLHARSLPFLLEQQKANVLPSMPMCSYIKMRQMPEARKIGKSGFRFNQNVSDNVCAYLANLVGLLPLHSSRHLRTDLQTGVSKQPCEDDKLMIREFCENRRGLEDVSIIARENSGTAAFIPSLLACGNLSLLAGGLFRDKLLKSVPDGSDLFAKWARYGRESFDEASTNTEAIGLGVRNIADSLGRYYHESLDLLAVFRRNHLRNVDELEDAILDFAQG